LWGLCVIR